MLIHLSNIIQSGVIDNTVRGLVDLRLWYQMDKEPLRFSIAGDCCRDIAGCRVSFSNRVALPSPEGDWSTLTSLISITDEFVAGDITLSHMSRDHDNKRALSRSISIELFADVRVRLLIDVDYFDFEIGLPRWSMSWEEDNLRALLSRDQLRAHISTNIDIHTRHHLAIDTDDFEICPWDKVLNNTEARASIFRTVRDKYIGENNSLTSTAYILGIPQLLGPWASLDTQLVPSRYYTGERPQTLFDYLEEEYRKPVQRAMQHPLFHFTSKLTEYLTPALQKIQDSDSTQGELVDTVMQTYARIVSRILASILLLQQSPDKRDKKLREKLIWRINHLQKRLITMRDLIPESAENNKRIHLTIGRIKDELEEFRHEVSR